MDEEEEKLMTYDGPGEATTPMNGALDLNQNTDYVSVLSSETEP